MQIKVRPKVRHFDPNIVDAASLFDACDGIAERLGRSKLTIDYAKLRECLDALRKRWEWRPASVNTILVSIDPSSEGQQRFQAMLKHSGFEIDAVHYRDTFVSPPPGRNPSEMTGKPIVSLASRIAYIAGLMARHEGLKPELLVVSHSFELCGPLTDLAHRLSDRDGKVGLAYFGSLLDYRWKAAGLFESQWLPGPLGGAGDATLAPAQRIGLKFFDLEPSCTELLGEEFPGTPHARVPAADGLNRF